MSISLADQLKFAQFDDGHGESLPPRRQTGRAMNLFAI